MKTGKMPAALAAWHKAHPRGHKRATKRTHEHKRKVKRRPPAARVSHRDPACMHDRKCSVVQGVRGLFWCPSCGGLHYDGRWHRPAK